MITTLAEDWILSFFLKSITTKYRHLVNVKIMFNTLKVRHSNIIVPNVKLLKCLFRIKV